MRSEIPQLEVITAIAEADVEDFVAQLLYSQGWSIIFRSFDAKMLEEFLGMRAPELRTIVVYTSDLDGLSSKFINSHQSPTRSFICIDDIPVQAHSIMTKIRSELRLPMLQQISTEVTGRGKPQIESAKSTCIVVTGTANAPGRTAVALALAKEFEGIRLIDADLKSLAIKDYIHDSALNGDVIRPTHGESYESSSQSTIVDLGLMQPIGEVVNDRRWFARYTNEILDAATSIVYVCRDNKQSLMQLSQFVKDFPLLLKQIPLTFVCVTSLQGKEYRVMSDAFKKLVNGHSAYLIRHSSLVGRNGIFGVQNSGKNRVKEIGSIATSVM